MFVAKLCKALEQDTRIDDVSPPSDPAFGTDLALAGIGTEGPEQLDWLVSAAEGSRLAKVLHQPIEFTVHVPKKNQLRPGDDADSPLTEQPASDRYLVRWDGAFLASFWEQSLEDTISGLGGPIVRDVLREALDRADLGSDYVAPTMTHQTVRVFSDEVHTFFEFRETASSSVDLAVNMPFDASGFATGTFGVMKDLAHLTYMRFGVKEAFYLANAGIRQDVRELLSLQRDHAERRASRSFKGLKESLRNRSWRHRARFLVARIWYAKTVAADLSREWLQYGELIAESGEAEAQGLVFARAMNENHDEFDAFVPTTDVALVENLSRGLDNRDLIRATTTAAIIGIAVGAVALKLLVG